MKLFFQIVSAIATYLVIFIQFMPQEDPNAAMNANNTNHHFLHFLKHN